MEPEEHDTLNPRRLTIPSVAKDKVRLLESLLLYTSAVRRLPEMVLMKDDGQQKAPSHTVTSSYPASVSKLVKLHCTTEPGRSDVTVHWHGLACRLCG